MTAKTRPARKRIKKKKVDDAPVLLLRTSEAMSFKRCEHQWYWNFVKRWRPRVDAPALRFGDLIHQSLAAYYKKGIKRGPKPWRTYEKIYIAQLDAELARLRIKTPEDEWFDALELGTQMLRRYVEQYKERDAEYRIISSEQTFQVPVFDDDGKLLGYVVGTLDGIWQKLSNKELWIKEFKTTGGAIAFDALQMDEQAGRYWTYGTDWIKENGILKPSQDLEGILYTVMRKSLPNPDWDMRNGVRHNQDGSVSKAQPGRYFDSAPIYRDRHDREIMRERVKNELIRIGEARAGVRPIIKNPGPLFMPNCRGCPFRDPCELHETGGDWKEMIKQTMVSWDPYADHEIKASERR